MGLVIKLYYIVQIHKSQSTPHALVPTQVKQVSQVLSLSLQRVKNHIDI